MLYMPLWWLMKNVAREIDIFFGLLSFEKFFVNEAIIKTFIREMPEIR